MKPSTVYPTALAIVCALGLALIALTMTLPDRVIELIELMDPMPKSAQALILSAVILSGVGIVFMLWVMSFIGRLAYDSVMNGRYRILEFTPPYRGAAPVYFPQKYVTRAKGERPEWECISPEGNTTISMHLAYEDRRHCGATSKADAQMRIASYKAYEYREYRRLVC